MIEKTVYDRELPAVHTPVTNIDKTDNKLKISCFSCIEQSIYLERNGTFSSPFNVDPMHLLLFDCIAFSGKTVNHKKEDDALKELFFQSNDKEFFELLENAAHFIYSENYNYKKFEECINKVFTRNSIGFRCNQGIFLIAPEPRMYDEIIDPCFHVLRKNGFEMADNNLHDAFTSLKEERYNEAIINATRAIESVLDKLFEDHGIDKPEKKNDIYNKIKNLVDNRVLPEYITGLVLESLILPFKIRNNTANVAHGSSLDESNNDLATYAIDATCSSILFIVRSANNETLEQDQQPTS